jgi:hypothetical protein
MPWSSTQGVALAFVNIERQVLPSRAKAPAGVVQAPRRHPDLGEGNGRGRRQAPVGCPAWHDRAVVVPVVPVAADSVTPPPSSA